MKSVLLNRLKPALALTVSAMAIAPAFAESPDDAAERAAATEAAMTDDERIGLTLGNMGSFTPEAAKTSKARPGAGYITGVPRLGVPDLYETDASLGVTWIGGARGNGGTQLPSGTAQGATFNTALMEQGGRMIGSEARAKGYNVLLAGGINLMRDPRNGRTFEYLGEDPLHSGLLAGAAVRGIQANHIISTVKHFAINPQETGRSFMNTVISENNLREADLLAFEIAIEQGDPGSIMCAYNATNGPQSCGNEFLLSDVLRDDWGYKGFVMSDWGAVDALDFALTGLDQQSGHVLDPEPFFGEQLKEAAQEDPAYRERLGEMVRSILYAMYDNELDTHPAEIGEVADKEANELVALKVAQEGIVLLENSRGILPLGTDIGRIAVIGGYADVGTLVGGGSSRVMGDEGPSISVPYLPGKNINFAGMINEDYNRSVPLKEIEKIASEAKVDFRDGSYPSEAALMAKQADVAIIFATQYQTEGFDVADLSLPNGQDALIAAVAAANPNTIVVLETGGPVAMPWKDDVAAVLEAWYPGARGAEAIAQVLFGVVNPSGHLPVSFPKSEAQLPRTELPGLDSVEPNFVGLGAPGQKLDVDYDIEGSDIGYRWYARQGIEPLYAFGHGLSYTTFAEEGLDILPGETLTARATIRNTGSRAGADVAQVYLTDAAGNKMRRLAGFAKLELKPGEAKQVDIPIDPRILAEWEGEGWTIAPGAYSFVLAEDALSDGPVATVELDGRSFGY